MRARIATVLGLLVACALTCNLHIASAARTPTYPCFRASQAPVIDGVIASDTAWEGVPGVSGFYVLGGGYTLAKQTTAFACYDDENLYVAMLCEEPDIAQVKSVMKDGDDLWTEDSVEIFVQPVVNGRVYQFAVSAGGATRGAEAASGAGAWQAAAHKAQDAYAIEAGFPLALFGDPPQPGGSYRVAFCRDIWTYVSGGDKFTCWPALSNRFLEPQNFAMLVFQPETATRAEAAKAEADLNAHYRKSLVQEIVALAPAVKEYLPTLELAAADQASDLRDEARRLIAQWQRLDRLARVATEAPLPQLRQAAAESSALRQTSYELKYRYLLEQLLADI